MYTVLYENSLLMHNYAVNYAYLCINLEDFLCTMYNYAEKFREIPALIIEMQQNVYGFSRNIEKCILFCRGVFLRYRENVYGFVYGFLKIYYLHTPLIPVLI